jgi:hypothetical protein
MAYNKLQDLEQKRVLHLWSYGAQHLTAALEGFSYRLRPRKLLVPKHKQVNYDQEHNMEYFNEYRDTRRKYLIHSLSLLP